MRFILLILAATLTLVATPPTICPSDPRIQIIGRVDRSDPVHINIAYPGVTLRFRFTGDLAVVQLTSDLDDTYVTTIVEGSKPEIRRLAKGSNEIEISAADIGPGPHTVEVVKRTEPWQGTFTFNGIRLGTGACRSFTPATTQTALYRRLGHLRRRHRQLARLPDRTQPPLQWL